MSTVLENTQPCTYKGALIHVDRISATSGRTKVNYLYLNSGRRVSKDLGPFPIAFTVSGYTYAQDGQQYADMRDALRFALDSPLDGDFVHPFISEPFWCAHGKYTFEETFGEVNICRFEIPFELVSKDGANPLTPTGALFSSSQIKTLALDANRTLQTACAEAFNASTGINRASASSLFGSLGNRLRDVFGPIGETLAKTAAYVDKALDIYEQADYYANNPLAAFAAIADGILGVDGLTADVYKKFRTIQAMFDFGDTESETNFAVTSPTRIVAEPYAYEDAERTNNANVIRAFTQGAALIQAFSISGESEPRTTDEIDEFLEVLDEQYKKISSLLTDDIGPYTWNLGIFQPDYSDSIAAIDQLRVAVSGYLNQKRAGAAYVKEVNVAPMPASSLAYLLYRDSSRMGEIMDLNQSLTDPIEVSGVLKVLSK